MSNVFTHRTHWIVQLNTKLALLPVDADLYWVRYHKLDAIRYLVTVYVCQLTNVIVVATQPAVAGLVINVSVVTQ
jgi:hypothetical protein